jgi:AraC-like DNA-binding protein
MRSDNSGTQQLFAPRLDHFPAIRSRLADEVEHGLIAVYDARRFDLKGDQKDFFVHANYKRLNEISLTYCAFGSTVEIDFPEAAYARELFVLSGRASVRAGRSAAELKQNDSLPLPAHEVLDVCYTENFEEVVLRIDEAAIARKLTALLGDAPCVPLQISVKKDVTPAQEMLRRLVLFTAQEIDGFGDGCETSPVVKEFEQAIIVSYLYANCGNYSGLLEAKPKDSAPWQVRAVEEYIVANWDKPIDISMLVAVTGVSARSIFQSFARARNYSPMTFLKRTRLEQARSRLRVGNPQTSVTAVAFACGFHNLGHFAREYREAFGELPSETIFKGKDVHAARHRQL